MTWWPQRWPRFLSVTPEPRPEITDRPGRYLGRLLGAARLPLICGATLSALNYVEGALVPTILGYVIDHRLGDGLSAHLAPGLVLLAVLGVLGGLVGAGTEFFSIGAWMSGWQPSLRGVAHHLGQRPLAVTRAISSGDVVSTATSDADRVGSLLYFIVNVIGSLLSTLVVAVLMLRMNVGLGLLVLLSLPIMLGGVGLLVKPLNRRFSAQREEQGRLTTVTADVVAGLRVLRGIGGEDVYAARYAQQSAAVRQAGYRVAATQAVLSAIRGGVPMALTALIVGASAVAALEGRLTPGEFVTFYGYTTFLLWPMSTIADLMQFMTRAWVAAKKVARVAEVPPLVTDEAVDPDATLRVGGDLVDDLSGVRCAGGKLTALVCAQPALSAALAERLGRPDDDATVTLGGMDLRHRPIDEVRSTVVVSGAHAEAFAGTLAEEVLGTLVPLAPERPLPDLIATYAGKDRPDGTRPGMPLSADLVQRAERALWVAAADDVVDSLGGLEGQLTEKARNLSGGQRQRLALARAVARQAPVLVLVEPTSALDSHTENVVAQRLREERAGRTTVLVSSSPLLLSRCDEVVVVESQQPTHSGTDPSAGSSDSRSGDGAEASSSERVETQPAIVREVARGTHHELSALPLYAAIVERGANV